MKSSFFSKKETFFSLLPGILFLFSTHLYAENPPQKIICLAPHITEICFALGLKDRIIGITDACVYPPETKTMPKVGSPSEINCQQIIALKPDLVLGDEKINRKEQLDTMRSAGLTVKTISCSTIEEIYPSIKFIGTVTQTQAQAETLINRMHQRIADIKKIIQGEKPSRVLLVFSPKPLVTCLKGSLGDELITLAGGVNIVSEPAESQSQLDIRTLMKRDPEVIIEAHTIDYNKIDPLSEVYARWAPWIHISAVKNGRIYVLPPIAFIPGPQIVDGLKILASALYPDKREEILKK